ncbi:putative membrane protein, partial [Vibrio parahaemolyticus 970107]
MICINNIIAVS